MPSWVSLTFVFSIAGRRRVAAQIRRALLPAGRRRDHVVALGGALRLRSPKRELLAWRAVSQPESATAAEAVAAAPVDSQTEIPF
jgi:hypothetical protein